MGEPYRRAPPDDIYLAEVRERYEQKCLRYLRTIGATGEEAEEAWVKTWESFWERPPQHWHDPKKLENWFYKGCKHDFLDICGKRRREAERTVSLDEIVSQEQEEKDNDPESGDRYIYRKSHGEVFSDQDPEYRAQVKATIEEIEDCLSPEEMEVVKLKAEGERAKQIGKLLNKSAAAVRKTLQRTREKAQKQGIAFPRRKH
jgi:RNA polymerase sigma factor (sigma-70 family)